MTSQKVKHCILTLHKFTYTPPTIVGQNHIYIYVYKAKAITFSFKTMSVPYRVTAAPDIPWLYYILMNVWRCWQKVRTQLWNLNMHVSLKNHLALIQDIIKCYFW